MGLNVNLAQMLGLPDVSICPKCKKMYDNNYDDYDIEMCGCNPKRGVWKLLTCCHHCEHGFTESFIVRVEPLNAFKHGKEEPMKTS